MLACTIGSRAACGLAVPLAFATASGAVFSKVLHEQELAQLASEPEPAHSTTDKTPPDQKDPVELSFLPLVEPAPTSRRFHGSADGKVLSQPVLRAAEAPPRPSPAAGPFLRRRAVALFLPRTFEVLALLVGPRAPPVTT